MSRPFTTQRSPRTRPSRHSAAALGLAALFAAPLAAGAQNGADLPRLYTNEQQIDDVSRRPALAIDNVRDVFRFVLGALPARVRVYPTENYYYFHFHHGGLRYAGNLRLAPDTRDRGEIAFVYYKATTGWHQDEADHYAVLGRDDGVAVEKVDDLAYRVAVDGVAVIFELNDLSAVRPPATSLTADEDYIGPVFDESGMRFFLVFDRRLKLFHYVLDETVPVNDELVTPEGLDHVLLGRRTGFAFAGDGRRKILIAIFGPNAAVNNHLDGPFDQLPDNFIVGDTLKDALLAAYPDLSADAIDRYGNHRGEQTREAITPYMEYWGPEGLEAADKCVAAGGDQPAYACLHAIAPD